MYREQKSDGIPQDPPTDWPEFARETYSELRDKLIDLGTLDISSLPQFERLCLCCATLRDTRDLLNKEGWTLEKGRATVAHPAVSVERRESKTFMQLCKRFGMTPASRARIKRKLESPSRE